MGKPHPRSFRHHFLSTQGFLYSCRSLLSLCRHSSSLLLLVGDSVVGFLGPPIAPIDSSRQTRATPSRKNTQTRTQPSNARSSFHPAYAWPSDNISQSTTSFFLPSRLIEQRSEWFPWSYAEHDQCLRSSTDNSLHTASPNVHLSPIEWLRDILSCFRIPRWTGRSTESFSATHEY